jgi:hypothetical protein
MLLQKKDAHLSGEMLLVLTAFGALWPAYKAPNRSCFLLSLLWAGVVALASYGIRVDFVAYALLAIWTAVCADPDTLDTKMIEILLLLLLTQCLVLWLSPDIAFCLTKLVDSWAITVAFEAIA